MLIEKILTNETVHSESTNNCNYQPVIGHFPVNLQEFTVLTGKSLTWPDTLTGRCR